MNNIKTTRDPEMQCNEISKMIEEEEKEKKEEQA